MTEHRQTVALDQLLRLVDLFSRDMAARFERDGLTPARTHLLWVLHHSGPSTGRALAQALRVTPRNVTGLVDALASDGMVERRPHPTDRRAMLVCLTAKGTESMTKMADDHRRLADLLFGTLPRARLAEFTATITDLADRLDRAIADEEATRS